MLRKPLLALLLVPLAPLSASAAGAQYIQTTTASVHAGMALASRTPQEAKSHFHHVINCLVNRRDKAYDEHAENPCEGMGTDSVALIDEAHTPAEKHALEHALDIAERGLRATSLDVAHVYAEWLSDILQHAHPQ